ncbi:MAG: ATP-binding cassette domain-containing protein [Actinomycetia bacterium]|nr:ATP-binding cassette domain-containing protein [Actinomycetes bacterium]
MVYLFVGLVAAVVTFALAMRRKDGLEAVFTVSLGCVLGALLGGAFGLLLDVGEGWVTVDMGAGWLIGMGVALGLWRWATGPLPPHEVANLGMVRTFQLTKALSKLSVIENMRLGAPNQRGEKFLAGLFQLWRSEEQAITERADALLERFLLTRMRDEFAGTLSGGQRKLLEMARALMTDPEVVMLDEPMAGVNPALTQSLLGHITSLRDDGMTVVFVEHDMDVVREISDWVVVMAEGKIIAEGPPTVVGQNQDVIDAYLGAHHDVSLEEIDETALEAEATEELEAEAAELQRIEEESGE